MSDEIKIKDSRSQDRDLKSKAKNCITTRSLRSLEDTEKEMRKSNLMIS